jgi:hypothetical protein
MGIRSLSTASISTGTKRSKVWDQSAVFNNNSYESIATVVVGSGGSSNLTFSSIPQTYKHLQIRGIGKFTNTSGTDITLYARFNGDTGANYAWHLVNVYFGGTTTTSSYGQVTATNQLGISAPPTSASGLGSIFGSFVVDISDYSSTVKAKGFRSIAGDDANATYGNLDLRSGAWNNTAAITTIDIGISSNTLAQYSHIALYGIKG